MLEDKIREAPFFKVQSGKIRVCYENSKTEINLQASIMSRALSLKKIENPAMSNFLSCLSEMVEYAKCVVTLPYSTHLTEIDSLCGSIFMSQKLQKTIRKIQGTLDEVHANHA